MNAVDNLLFHYTYQDIPCGIEEDHDSHIWLNTFGTERFCYGTDFPW